jgi:hypothetical protein
VSRMCRVAVFLLLAFLSLQWGGQRAETAGTSVTLRQGSLAISPSVLTVSYTAPAAGTNRTVTSSFAVHVMDARGTKEGWDIRASVIATAAPSGAFPTSQQSITGVTITNASGTRPTLSVPSSALLPAQQVIARSAPGSGMGQSTESFSTQLILADGLPAGQYTATLLLFVTQIGAVNAIPGQKPGGPPGAQGVVIPLPGARPAPAAATGLGPNPLPGARVGQGRTTASSASTSSAPPGGQTATASPQPDGSDTRGTTPVAAPVSSTSMLSVPSSPAASTTNTSDVPVTIASDAESNLAVQSGVSAQSGNASSVSSSTYSTDNSSEPVVLAPDSVALDLAAPDDLTTLPQLTVPTTASPYPIVMIDRGALTVTLPFAPPLYDPAAGGLFWHMQTTLLSGPANKLTIQILGTTPIRTNLGHFFSAALDLVAGKALIAVYPLESASDLGTSHPDDSTLLVTIGAGP